MASSFSSKLMFWPRWFWRTLTSMRTALVLLLMLALAAVPGSIVPQRSADPNGVRLYFDRDPVLAETLDFFQLFDVYTSVWFSAIYILLFVSLVGCVVPRTSVHLRALRSEPVSTPANLSRMPVFIELKHNSSALAAAQKVLREFKYRQKLDGNSISAEKGYLKETGNLIFHFSLIGVLIAVGIGGGLSFSGQRVLVEGDGFVNNLASYDAFSPGVFFDESALQPFALSLSRLEVVYDLNNPANIGQPIDFIASVSVKGENLDLDSEIKVNYPLEVPGASVYLTGNGFAPVITVRDQSGNVAFSGPVVFLPQDSNNTSLGVIKVPDASPEQLGFVAFFYPTAEKLESGAYTSIYPDPLNPVLTMNLYTGDLGLDQGIPRNVYALDTTNMREVASRTAANPPLFLEVGDTVELPENLGSVTFDGLKRYASLDIAYNPGGIWILTFALLALASVSVSLLVPRRRIWVKLTDEKIEVAALARSEDPKLGEVIAEFVEALEKEMAKS